MRICHRIIGFCLRRGTSCPRCCQRLSLTIVHARRTASLRYGKNVPPAHFYSHRPNSWESTQKSHRKPMVSELPLLCRSEEESRLNLHGFTALVVSADFQPPVGVVQIGTLPFLRLAVSATGSTSPQNSLCAPLVRLRGWKCKSFASTAVDENGSNNRHLAAGTECHAKRGEKLFR